MTRGDRHEEENQSDAEVGAANEPPNQNDALRNKINQYVRKTPEVSPPWRAMVRTRMPDAPGGMGISIRPLPREACAPRIPPDTDDSWDQAETPVEESPETPSEEP